MENVPAPGRPDLSEFRPRGPERSLRCDSFTHGVNPDIPVIITVYDNRVLDIRPARRPVKAPCTPDLRACTTNLTRFITWLLNHRGLEGRRQHPPSPFGVQ